MSGNPAPKEIIFNTFLDLCGEKKFEYVTVRELCEKANVSRQTFYRHFRDKQSLLDCFCKRYLCLNLTSPEYSREDFCQELQNVMLRLWDVRQVLKNILFYGKQNSIYEAMFDASDLFFQSCLYTRASGDEPSYRLLSRGYAYARFGLLKDWVEQDEFFADKRHVELILQLCPEPLLDFYHFRP